MKVGVFHPALDWYGGAEVVAVATANSLIEQGHEVVLFINNWVDQNKIKEMIGEPLSSSIRVIVKPDLLSPRSDFQFYESTIKCSILKWHCDILVDTYNCCVFPWSDVIYIHFPYPNNTYFSPKFPYLRSTSAFRDIVRMPYVFLEKNLANYDGKLLLANSYFTAKATEDAWGVRPEVLYPPIPSAMFEKSNIRLEPRDNFVVTLARFGLGKEVELVPKIASLTDKSIKYLMIGLAHDPTVIKDVKQKIRQLKVDDRVAILTNASRQEIKSHLANAKVYLHTKKNEHFGISIAEAMAMGCLPVVHNSGGAPEFVPDQYRYTEIHEAAAIIDKAVQGWSSDKAQKMVEIAARFSETNFSNRFEKLFTEYCHSKGQSK